MKWSDLLKNEEKVVDPTGVKLFHEWIRDSFAANKPLDRFVRELIAARGSTYENPPANYYRANRDAVTRAEATAQVFLGMRLGCAKCHNHPFDRWTQDDYYRWAALFARVDYKIVENNRPDDNDKHQFDGEQIVLMAEKGEVEDPRTKRSLASRGSLARRSLRRDDSQDRLLPLAAWLASPRKRVVCPLTGEPHLVPPAGPRAGRADRRLPRHQPGGQPGASRCACGDFVASGFDVRHLVRTIMSSRTYQLSAEPNETNARRRDQLLAGDRQAAARRATARCADAVIGGSHKLTTARTGTRAGQAAGVGAFQRREGAATARTASQPMASDAEKFLKLFGKPPRLLTCECERCDRCDSRSGVSALKRPDDSSDARPTRTILAKLLASSESPREIIDELYWSASARGPTDDEREGTSASYGAVRPIGVRGWKTLRGVWSTARSSSFADNSIEPQRRRRRDAESNL